MRISDWSSDVCSSDLTQTIIHSAIIIRDWFGPNSGPDILKDNMPIILPGYRYGAAATQRGNSIQVDLYAGGEDNALRSEEHTTELQSLMRISYAVFCLKKKNNISLNSNQLRPACKSYSAR